MLKLITEWYKRNFTNPQVVVLTLFLVLGFIIIAFVGELVLPVLVAVVMAYLLDGLVVALEKRRVPRIGAVIGIYTLFITLYLVVIFALVPLIYVQLSEVAKKAPDMFDSVADQIEQFLAPEDTETPTDAGDDQPDVAHATTPNPGSLPTGKRLDTGLPPSEGTGALDEPSGENGTINNGTGTESQVQAAEKELRQALRERIVTKVSEMGPELLRSSLEYFQSIVVLFVYMLLFPILVFFMLKDKVRILNWFKRFLPQERRLASDVWLEVDRQMANYVRGKAWEILIVGGITFFVFTVMGLNYSLLLAIAVGLSVLVPYVGATVVTFPVAIVAYYQWGFGPHFWYILGAYGVIQAFDGNLLVPIIFSEAVNLHPIAIIFAVLFFGGIWGFWGVLFAIPLATLVQAVIQAWPREALAAADPKPVIEEPSS